MNLPLRPVAARCLVLAVGLGLTSCDEVAVRHSSGPVTAMVPPPPPPARVTFFDAPNFRGESFVVEAGAEVADLSRLPRAGGNWDRAISSFRVEGPATVAAFSYAGFGGARLEAAGSVPDLAAERRGADDATNWDRIIGSVRVLPPRVVIVAAPLPGPPPGYEPRTAEAMVRRAYRDILGREPDNDGLRNYRDKLVHGGWTEDMLRSRLKDSAEAEAINPDDIIRRAYRDLLKRDPDPDGLQHYRDLMRNSGWTPEQVRTAIMDSKEYKNRPRK